MSGDLRLYLRLLREARPYWRHMGALLACSLLAIPAALLVPLPLKIAVDSVIGNHPAPSFLPESSSALLVALCGLLVLIALTQQVLRLATTILQAYTGERLVLDFRAKLFEHVQRLSLGYHDSRGSADAIYRIQYDALAIQKIAVDAMTPLITAVFTVVGMIAVTASIDWQLAVVAIALAPLIVIGSWRYRTRVRPRWREAKKLETSALSVVQEVLGALRVVHAFGQEEREQRRFVHRSTQGMRTRLRLTLLQGGFGVAVGLATALGTATVLYVGVSHVQSGRLTLGALLLVMAYLTQLYDPLETASAKTASLQSAMANAERAFELLDTPLDVPERPDARPLGHSRGAIAFHSVSFAYVPGHPVLHGVTFRANPGSHIAIAGTTGAGKTTLVSLLMRFYDPDAGRIELDGVDLRDLRLRDLRRQFAIVLQEPLLFSTSIAENIAYARPGANADEIEAAARAAHAHEFITALPDGYETLVGERGVRLSGGERQRISLARAFVKDAPVLILDEATSSVDVRTEALIVDAMQRLMRGRTTFVIAHRPSTLAACHLQLQIEAGRIVAVGLPSSNGGRRTPGMTAQGESLERLLAGTGAPALNELRATLRDLAGPDAAVSAQTPIKTRVFRVTLRGRAEERRLILKLLEPAIARRTALVAKEWLPAVGLAAAGPPLAGVAAERGGSWVWHIYDDLGAADLVGAPASGPRVGAAVELIAQLHARFADHHLLPEIRREGGDLGVPFFETSVTDLAAALQRLLRTRPTPERAELCERLLARTDELLTDLPSRGETLTVCGGPETLLHGDLWTTNTFVLDGHVARLIDWDHAAVGPAAYDLSTFLSRFPASERRGLLARYRAAAARGGLLLPSDAELELAFDTAERGRLANCGLWPALAITQGLDEWGWRRLRDVADWLDEPEAVLA